MVEIKIVCIVNIRSSDCKIEMTCATMSFLLRNGIKNMKGREFVGDNINKTHYKVGYFLYGGTLINIIELCADCVKGLD